MKEGLPSPCNGCRLIEVYHGVWLQRNPGLLLLLPVQVYRSMLDAVRGIVQQGGVTALYRGMGVTLLEIMPYAALQFSLYDAFTQAAERARARVSRSLAQHQT